MGAVGYVKEAGKLRLERCRVSGSGAEGVFVLGQLHAENCVVVRNSNNGICLWNVASSRAVLIKCTLRKNSGWGRRSNGFVKLAGGEVRGNGSGGVLEAEGGHVAVLPRRPICPTCVAAGLQQRAQLGAGDAGLLAGGRACGARDDLIPGW